MKNKTPIILLGIFLSVSLIACEQEQIEERDFPTCIQTKIDDLMAREVQNPPAFVTKYRFNDADYFYISSDCCDQYSDLFDGDCQLICHPDGGITGNGDGKCEFELDQAEDMGRVWEDDRE